MNKNFYIIMLLLLMLGSSCEEVLDETIDFERTNLLVVEGVLTNERIRQKVKLTHPYASQNEPERPATGAIVVIADSDQNITLLRESPRGSGEYFTDSLRAVFGKVYALIIRYKGNEYRAFDATPPGQLLPPLKYNAIEVDGQTKFELQFEDSGVNPNYINYNVDWSATSSCTTQPEDCQAKLVYYDLKNIDVQKIYAPEKEDIYFPPQSTVIRKRYSVSGPYQDFLRSLLSETEWRGGVFDIQRDQVPTNLSEGAIGFFAVTTVVKDTTVLR
ncbi:DUF4249 family protein [Fulvivirga lutimaris]|uniref:DUF4249 family protein n=1 Tax=Fulvivirga lutimaris TaxID=1819566 RepID=UPI0012BC5AAB|nr:DUF4249 family protein [Fulvivirga lutimaris]MTI41178.1 DUF4249 family protein [Fulvivirga lutimaris]